MTKIDLNNFTQPQMTARLFSLLRCFGRINLTTAERLREYTEMVVEQNFIYNPEDKDKVVAQLELFFLGNTNNSFSKIAEL